MRYDLSGLVEPRSCVDLDSYPTRFGERRPSGYMHRDRGAAGKGSILEGIWCVVGLCNDEVSPPITVEITKNTVRARASRNQAGLLGLDCGKPSFSISKQELAHPAVPWR